MTDPIRPTDHLANERTFLAWLRTGLSILGLGFVVAKFGLWLRQLSMLDGTPRVPRTGASLLLGLALLAASALVIGLSAIHYQKNRRALERGSFVPARHLITASAAGAIALVVLLAIYLIITDHQA